MNCWKVIMHRNLAQTGIVVKFRNIAPEKIGPEHHARPALVYVRQSTISQVRHHHESRRRQYDLAARAKQLGWHEVSVIDEDLERSGASSAARTGFKHVVAEVGLGRIGAIFAIEVSRLARNNRDWYQLLDLCGLMDTLIIDDEGVYNTRQPNDRLLLGLKGTMSEAELGWIRQRALLIVNVGIENGGKRTIHRSSVAA